MPRALLVLCAAVALAIVGTWPLAARLSTHVYDPSGEGHWLSSLLLSDVYLTVWILAWDAHALFTHPQALFAANIFHPAPDTLALSEHVLGAMPLYLPLAALMRDPIAAHQATLVLSFALAFLAAVALVRDWTASWPAAVAAGILFAFSGFRGGGLDSLHIEGNYFMPLVPLYAQRAVRDGRLRWPALLFVVLTLQALHSYYLAYATFLGLAVLLSVVFVLDPSARRRSARLIFPTLGAIAAVALVTLPYLRVAAAGALSPTAPQLVRLWSGSLGRTGATGALVACVMTGWFWTTGLQRHVPRAWLLALLAAATATHVLALGPAIQLGGWSLPAPFALLQAVIPGFDRVRSPVRFNVMATMCLSALAGVGVAGALRRIEARVSSGARWIPGAAVVGLTLLSLPLAMQWPVPTRAITSADEVPPVYRWLASAEPGPLLELPFNDVTLHPFGTVEEARRMYLSTHHWHPLLNGYSGYAPPSYRVVSGLVGALPDAEALTLLRRATGLRYVVLHTDRMSADARSEWLARGAGLGVTRSFGKDALLALPEMDADLRDRLRASDLGASTLVGTPLAAVRAEDRRARLTIVRAVPATALAGVPFDIALEVANVGSAIWPVLSTDAHRVVELMYRWQDRSGRELSTGTSPLPYDLGPSRSVVTAMTVRPPATAGEALLTIGVGQAGDWFQGSPPPIAVGLS